MDTSEEDFFRLIRRSRSGFQSFCAMIDLLGVARLTVQNHREAAARLNDLQGGFFDGLIDFFPGGDDYRICYAGDSVFVVEEIDPDSDWRAAWPKFCGHMYALSCLVNSLDTTIGNVGLRTFVAYGPVLQIREPDAHRRRVTHPNWFVLTGASMAFAKCWEAERQGSAAGFVGPRFWHERPDAESNFLGTALAKFETLRHLARDPNAYPQIYDAIKADVQNLTCKLRSASD
jgi:hypothetical protein